MFSDRLDRHFFSGPEAEGFGTLEKQHVKPVKGGTAICGSHLKQACLLRIVNDIRHDQFRTKHGSIRDRTGICVRSHAKGSGVGQDRTGFKCLPQGCFISKIRYCSFTGSVSIDRVGKF